MAHHSTHHPPSVLHNRRQHSIVVLPAPSFAVSVALLLLNGWTVICEASSVSMDSPLHTSHTAPTCIHPPYMRFFDEECDTDALLSRMNESFWCHHTLCAVLFTVQSRCCI